jgi:hypothetical protein
MPASPGWLREDLSALDRNAAASARRPAEAAALR